MSVETPALPTDKTPTKRSWKRRSLWLVAILTVTYFGILGMLAANETYLVYPGSKFPKGDWSPKRLSFEEVTFSATGGPELVGWFLPAPEQDPRGNVAAAGEQPIGSAAGSPPRRTILICHGNAENVAQVSQWYGDRFRNEFNADVFVFDYRGYGKSGGTPDEPGVLADTEAALDWLCQRRGVQADQVILVGHSIGGGPAVHVAAKRGCQTLVLQRTFSSLADAAQAQYPWLPIRYVMQNQYPSAEKIKSVSAPLFQSHGELDVLIPIELAERLFNNSPATKKRFFRVEQMSHWDPLPEHYWTELLQFVVDVETEAAKQVNEK